MWEIICLFMSNSHGGYLQQSPLHISIVQLKIMAPREMTEEPTVEDLKRDSNV